MKYMAHIVQGKVVNVSLWDGQSDWNPEGQLVELPTKEYVDPESGQRKVRVLAGIGWDYVDGEFIDNRPPPERLV